MNVIFETLTDYGQRFAIVQRYIPDIVETGDSRVLLIDGEPVPYALARIPSADRQPRQPRRGRQGRRPAAERARPLARRRRSGPRSPRKGMMFVGLDVIGGFVTEINVTSPTGIRELDKQFNLNIGDLLIQAILRRKLRYARMAATDPVHCAKESRRSAIAC